MISSIEGYVEEKDIDRLVINVSGIGYEIFTTTEILNQLETAKPIKLFIHEQIKEDAHVLYGFTSSESRQLFNRLLSVKNVGPKVALAVMNLGSSEKIRQAIAAGDTKLLQSAKGVGRRAAEQIVVELRDKVGLLASAEAEAVVGRSGDMDNDEAVEALISLGFDVYDAKKALVNIDPTLSTQERIKLALKSRA
jgi:Holliday junction DNA helicase RuvA